MVGSVQVHNRRESAALDMKAYSHLSAEERIRIDELRNRDGLGVRQIALRIGRDKATVSRELKRGLWFASNENDSYRPYRPKRLKTGPWTCRPFYSAMTAQRKAEQRAREPRKPRRMAYDPLLAWVMTALRKGWTPERIEGRLFLVKSVFRVSSLIFFGFRHEECRPVVCFTGCPSCRT